MHIKSGVIIYDRGMTAKNTIFELINDQWKVIAGMPMNKGIKKFILKLDLSKLQKSCNLVRQGYTTFYVITKKYYFGKTSGKLVIILNSLKKQHEKMNRDMDLQDYKNNNKSKKNVFFTKDKKINSKKVIENEHFDGLSFIFTTGKFSRAEIIKLYFEKDLIEKSFHCLKGVLSLRPVRVWLDENIKAHIFICYLSYALMSSIRCKLSKNRAKKGLDGLSAENALKELSYVFRVYFSKNTTSNGKKDEFFKLVSLSKKQENILKAIDPKLAILTDNNS